MKQATGSSAAKIQTENSINTRTRKQKSDCFRVVFSEKCAILYLFQQYHSEMSSDFKKSLFFLKIFFKIM